MNGEFTYTVFARNRRGAPLHAASTFVATGSSDGTTASYSLMPGTIAPRNFASMHAERLSDDTVGVTVPASQCFVGAPYLASTTAVGQNAFYGEVVSCGVIHTSRTAARHSERAGDSSQVEAVIDTDVPLSAVFQQYSTNADLDGACTNISPTEPSTTDASQCDSTVVTPDDDTDDDGLSDIDERDRYGTDPNKFDTDGDGYGDGDEVANGTNPLDPNSPARTTPTSSPTTAPTDDPTMDPTDDPTMDPTDDPTMDPTDDPTMDPTDDPTIDPGDFPTNSGRTTAPRPSAAPGIFKRPKATCEGSGSRKVALNPYVKPNGTAKLSLKNGRFDWNIDASLTLGINPSINIEGSYECGLDLKGVSVQLTYAPVPVNLSLAPLVKASASASFELTGPNISATIGFHTDGHVQASVKTCTFFDVPCGIDIDKSSNSRPTKAFNVSSATVHLKGSLGLDLGVTATIALGYENTFVGVKAGFSFDIVPVSASLTVAVHNKSGFCATLGVGGKIGISLDATAWVIRKSWSLEFKKQIAEFEIDYGLSKSLPSGCDG